MVKSLGGSNNKVTRCRNEHQPKDPSKQSFQKQRFLMKSGKNGQLTGHQLQRNTSCAFSLFFTFSSFFPLPAQSLCGSNALYSLNPWVFNEWSCKSFWATPQFVLGFNPHLFWLASSFISTQILIYFDLPTHLQHCTQSRCVAKVETMAVEII